MTRARDLQSADAEVRLSVLDELAAEVGAGGGAVGVGDLSGLLERCLGDPVKRVQRRAAELMAQAAAADLSVELRIAELLRAPGAATRWGAAYSQAVVGRVSLAAVEIWIESLASSDKDLRWAAHELIVRHLANVPQALERLRMAAGGDDNERRKMALYCLRDVGIADDLHQELALRGVGATDIGVRLAGLSALPAVASAATAAAVALCPYLDDSDVRVRRAVAATLGNLGVLSAEVEAGLVEASSSDDASLRRAAEGALGKVRSRRSV